MSEYPTKILLFFEFPHNGGAIEQLFTLLGCEFCPKIAVIVGGCYPRRKALIAEEWGGGVVGTAGLTLVATKDPSVRVKGVGCAHLDGAIGDAEGGVDCPIGANCSRWAS